MSFTLNHVALLVPSVDESAARLKSMGFLIQPPDVFKTTREIYVGDLESERGLLLLMEPRGEGSYKKALEKRGPGLHHLAIDVPDMKAFLLSLEGSGWFLLPHSAADLHEDHGTAWLARPGFPSLIEVQERQDMEARSRALVHAVELPGFERHKALIAALRNENLVASPDSRAWLRFADRRLAVDEMI